MKFMKYHALGNVYIIINPSELKKDLSKDIIRLICQRNYGIGSDGILLGPLLSQTSDFGLKIYNSDGSEADISGNGLCIFSKSLFDNGYTNAKAFTIETLSRVVSCELLPDNKRVKIEMGMVSFDSTIIPLTGKQREVLNETIDVKGRSFNYCAASIGNPHCVVMIDEPTKGVACQYGPFIETDIRFPKRTNVQFMKVLDRFNIQIEIWERGSGYTLASGSSSTASAAVARKLGFCDSNITVHMPGGQMNIQFNDNFIATMTSSVTKICEGIIENDMIECNTGSFI